MEKLNLQMFAEEETTQEQTQEVAITQEAVDAWLSTDEGKKYLQPKLDSYHTKGLQSWQEKNIDKIKSEAIEGIKAENQKQLDELNSQLQNNTIMSKYQNQLLKEGLRAEKLDLAMKLSDTSKLSLDGDNLFGSTDMIGGLKEKVGDWFGEAKRPAPTPGGTGTGGKAPGTGQTDADVTAFAESMGIKI